MKYNDIQVQPLKGRKYKLLLPIIYRDVMVPIGYKTNGADIPRVFWSFCPPNTSDILPAVIVHDYLCYLEEYQKADDYFEEILTILRIKPWKITILVGAVRLYHSLFKG